MAANKFRLALSGVVLLVLLAEICLANEKDLKSLNEQIKLKDPYGALSDYLVEKRLLSDFEQNKEVARELMDDDKFGELIESANFKQMVMMLTMLEGSFDKVCEGSNLANLRGLAAMMKLYSKKRLEGSETRHRLNRLLIDLSQRAYLKCLALLQDEWSEVNFEMALMDEPSRRALAVLEAEVDFVELIRSEYNPNLRNEHLFRRGLRCALEHLHSQRMGESFSLSSLEPIELAKHIDYYLADSCTKMRARFSESEQKTINKYLDLVTLIILMHPQVLDKQDERNNFAVIRVKGAGRVVACNKLLGAAENSGGHLQLAQKLVGLAQAEARASTPAHVCKLSHKERPTN